jgi:hypothetical protein
MTVGVWRKRELGAWGARPGGFRSLADVPLLRAVLWGIAAGAAVRPLGVTDAVFSNLVVSGAAAAVVTVGLARVTRRRVANFG